jgi:prephenate dehydrogenase
VPSRQITIIGNGLIGGSLGLALKKRKLVGRIVGCDRPGVLERAQEIGAVDTGVTDPAEAVRGSSVVVLAAPVIAIIDLIERLGPSLPAKTLLTDVGSTKAEVVARAQESLGEAARQQFLAGHPMAGKEHAGVEAADADLFQGAAWFVTPLPGQDVYSGHCGEFLEWVEKLGARIASLPAQEHDQLCAWISHLPQMISTALAASLVDEFGSAPLLEAGGRALREMTRISSSPYSMWRDIAITNKTNIADALHKLEQRLAHIRENLDSRELAAEFDRAHELKKEKPPKAISPRRHRGTERSKA